MRDIAGTSSATLELQDLREDAARYNAWAKRLVDRDWLAYVATMNGIPDFDASALAAARASKTTSRGA